MGSNTDLWTHAWSPDLYVGVTHDLVESLSNRSAMRSHQVGKQEGPNSGWYLTEGVVGEQLPLAYQMGHKVCQLRYRTTPTATHLVCHPYPTGTTESH